MQPVAEEQETVVQGQDDVRHQTWFELNHTAGVCGQ
jgi:hypothetical protein